LLQVLSPRADIGMYSSSKTKRKKLKEIASEKESSASGLGDSLDDDSDEPVHPAAIVASFKESQRRELESMRKLRAINQAKPSVLPSTEECRYCVCRRGAQGSMLQCQLCRDWFHSTCVALPRPVGLKKGQSAGAKEPRFLCPLCQRSRRPRLETILALLVALQKLPVRLPEGEALQCLTEHAMAWQDRARQALATPELASALAKLSVLSQRLVEQAAREKTEKIIHAELQKAAANPELQAGQPLARNACPRLERSGQTLRSFHTSKDNSGFLLNLRLFGCPLADSRSPSNFSLAEMRLLCEEEVPMETEEWVTASFCSEHAYSSASKSIHQGMSMPRKQPRKSPLVPRSLDSPVLRLSEGAQARLEELILEGDLLEVSMDESLHLWRILQATQSPPGDGTALGLFQTVGREGKAVKARARDKDQLDKKRKRKLEKGELTFGGDAAPRDILKADKP
uniref:PHD-type domain-containing protein n=1 Tax=Petromyzon marinus TaxID=7757 RepID=S4RKK6_PETMA